MKKEIKLIMLLISINQFYSQIPNDNDYFDSITKKLSPINNNLKEVQLVKQLEINKFKNSGEEKFFLSSKYVELFLYQNDRFRQLPLVYELLKLNKDKYIYISIACYFNLSFQFEHNSPSHAMSFINKAIAMDQDKKYFLPHLYHLKGRLYYNNKDYYKAIEYFEKSFKNLDKKETIFIASMHNNFGLSYDKLNRLDDAILQTQKGILLLDQKPRLNLDEERMLNVSKSNLASYFLKKRQYKKAKDLLQNVHYFFKKAQLYSQSLECLKMLLDISLVSGEEREAQTIVEYLTSIQIKLKTTDQIFVKELLLKFYISKNNIKCIKETAQKLVELHHKADAENRQNIKELSFRLSDRTINTINEDFQQKISSEEKRKKNLIIIFLFLSVIFLLLIVLVYKQKKKEKEIVIKEKEIVIKEKEIIETNQKLMESELQFKKDKIKDLQNNLNLKIEAQNFFLENLKNLKNSKYVDSEQVFKDLLFKVNELVQIDQRNYLIINESYNESELFTNHLSLKYPQLTKREVRLCTYFRMHLSVKEISSIENTSTGTIRVYRSKIKTKLGLVKGQNLDDILASM